MPRELLWRCALCGWLNAQDAKACASCEKRKPRARKAKPPPSFRPWRAAILSLDCGARSGWAIWIMGKLAASGEHAIYTGDGLRETVRVVELAKSHASLAGIPWVAVRELAWGGRMGVGMGEAGGYWRFALRNAQLSASRLVDVYPATWRARVLPKGAHAMRREAVRKLEAAAARELVPNGKMGADQAPAILIGRWATQAGAVGAALPSNARKTV